MYQAIYKCRLCGEFFLDDKAKFEKEQDFRISNIVAQTEPCVTIDKHVSADIHRMHYCKDGSFGFCDFQGFKEVED